MKPDTILYPWESFPEYIATQQYSRCMGRIIASLPKSARRRAQKPLVECAVLIAQGIAGAHAETPSAQAYTRSDREVFRDAALASLSVSRMCLNALRGEGHGSPADMFAALELLERVESGLRSRPLPAS
jgi:hypothetical protein